MSSNALLEGILKLKATQPKIQHLQDSVAKLDGAIEQAKAHKGKLKRDSASLRNEKTNIELKAKVKQFSKHWKNIRDWYFPLEDEYYEAQEIATEFFALGIKQNQIRALFRKAGIDDSFSEHLLSLAWPRNSNFVEALLQLSRHIPGEFGEENPFHDFSGGKRSIRQPADQHPFKKDHIASGWKIAMH